MTLFGKPSASRILLALAVCGMAISVSVQAETFYLPYCNQIKVCSTLGTYKNVESHEIGSFALGIAGQGVSIVDVMDANVRIGARINTPSGELNTPPLKPFDVGAWILDISRGSGYTSGLFVAALDRDGTVIATFTDDKGTPIKDGEMHIDVKAGRAEIAAVPSGASSVRLSTSLGTRAIGFVYISKDSNGTLVTVTPE